MNDSDFVDDETSVKLSWLSVITRNPDDFLEELENLCKKFSIEGTYFFRYAFEDLSLLQ